MIEEHSSAEGSKELKVSPRQEPEGSRGIACTSGCFGLFTGTGNSSKLRSLACSGSWKSGISYMKNQYEGI